MEQRLCNFMFVEMCVSFGDFLVFLAWDSSPFEWNMFGSVKPFSNHLGQESQNLQTWRKDVLGGSSQDGST